ncbi:MAG TPA: hypothetical protein DEE98_00655 [Elusimicrobia bacterium]|nr:MAG: hypothetical protein A2278_03285 [Elusimicrobia bacterium RIFOXYA12_FULL_49_49]OGS10883.1 MAG: hypothetical protein A2386_06775 [Elusimicrobia bacterium RIFOXYB1_FULL_48_9]OGS15586.1 MAG: hypothetical protein A2251_03535 [Elusimicrobia bacterium RIFOXYA2_FULL_47_53]OGS26858.1 MAG: hypothetical protein A2339_07445 [Elusimicrobia bacterium RIFOXYB12_FULL_50_12]OGS30685.1 MAG: hypothetical protein A2323_07340 [Elusimicrobia bacterium RIFOXYB2_FULL_46_23]HBU68876.1 hypothetical protein [El
MPDNNPLVSVIIPAYNSEATVAKCLDSVLSQDYKNIELIVVDDGSTDSTPAILSSYEQRPGVKVIKVINGGPSKARNLGIQYSKGEFLAFTDADCIVKADWITRLLECFNSDAVAGAGGDQLSPPDETGFGKTVNDFMRAIGFISDYIKDKAGGPAKVVSHNPTCNVMYRREIISKLGAFLEELWPGEDVELDYRIIKAGHRLLYTPGAVVYHYRPKTLALFSKMMNRYGYAQAFLVKKYGFWRVLHFVPVILPLLVVYDASIWAYDLPLFVLTNAIGAALIYLYFSVKSGSAVKGSRYFVLYFVTLFSWLKGFYFEILRKK